MNPKARELWLAALRSGKYKQGQGVLYKITPSPTGEFIDRYCCLGVLCEVAIENGVEVHHVLTKTAIQMGVYDDALTNLPQSVCLWAECEPDPSVRVNDELTRLSIVNDDLRASFTSIANLIEAQL